MKRYIRSSKNIQYRIYEVWYDEDHGDYEEAECIDTADSLDEAISIAKTFVNDEGVEAHVVEYDIESEYTEVVWTSYE